MSPLSRHIIKLIFLVDVILALSILAEQKLSQVDAAFYTALGRLTGHASGDYAQLHTPGAPVQMEKVILREQKSFYPTVRHIVWVADGREDLPSLPLPKLQELATILNCLKNKIGVSDVGVSTPLMWEDERDEMAHHMLTRALQGYHHVCLGLPARNAAQAEATPEQLKAAIIPARQIEGNPAALPYANTPLPYHSPVADASALLWAPDYVEDEPNSRDAAQGVQGLSAPLLMRWKGDVLPTLPLRLALAKLGLSPADVQVRLGKSIRIGKRLLPLDAQGRAPLGAARVKPTPLAEVLSAPPATGQEPGAAILSRAFTPEHSSKRGEQLAATLSLLLGNEEEAYIPTERPAGNMLLELNPLQSALAGRLLIAALVVCALVWLPLLPARRRYAVLGGVAGLFFITCLVWFCLGMWASLSAAALCGGLLTGAIHLLSKHPRP